MKESLHGLCPHCGKTVRLSQWSGNTLAHSGPRDHAPGCPRETSGSCADCGLSVYKDGRRCPGSYKKPIEEKEGTK